MGTKSLKTALGKLKLETPVIIVSGIFSYGEIDIGYLDYKKLGAIVTKTITFTPKEGNPQPRIWETPSGMINCIGLQNPGIQKFINKKLYSSDIPGVKTIVSISGQSIDDIKKITEMLVKKDVRVIELNLSCPNVNRQNLMVSQNPEDTYNFVKAAKEICENGTLIAKLSPSVTDITEIAMAAEDGGADILSLINTLKAIAIDSEKRSVIDGGLSGPAIKPVGLKAVYDTYKKTDIPLIGIGGITTGQDALEYILAGASAIGVGSALFSNPHIADQICKTLTVFLEKNNLKHISEATGFLNEKKKTGANKSRKKH